MTKNKKTKYQNQEYLNKKQQELFNKQADKKVDTILGWIAIIVLILIVGGIVNNIFGWVGDKMDSRDSRKQRCIEETYNIKNEFTAKKMYKACMKR